METNTQAEIPQEENQQVHPVIRDQINLWLAVIPKGETQKGESK